MFEAQALRLAVDVEAQSAPVRRELERSMCPELSAIHLSQAETAFLDAERSEGDGPAIELHLHRPLGERQLEAQGERRAAFLAARYQVDLGPVAATRHREASRADTQAFPASSQLEAQPAELEASLLGQPLEQAGRDSAERLAEQRSPKVGLARGGAFWIGRRGGSELETHCRPLGGESFDPA